MNRFLLVFAVCLSALDVIKANPQSDVTGRPKHPGSRGGRGNTTGSDDVRCATTDDVIAARRSLCPPGCRCLPLSGDEVWTKLTVDCSASHQYIQAEHLVEVLSRCVSKLTDLSVINSRLTTLPDVVCLLNNIRSLNLDNNRLTALPGNCFTRMRNLTSFSASSNRLTSLQEGVFTNLPELERLSLSNNAISFIEPRVFIESANLSALSNIDLSRNAMTGLEPWPIIRSQHRRMSIRLESNRIVNFTNALRWRFNCNSTRVLESHLDLSDNDIEHISDVIDGWNIDEPNRYVGLLCLLNPLMGEPMLHLDIDYSPFNCDCRDYEIININRFYGNSHLLDRANCDQPPNLYNTKLLNVHLDRLVCDVTELCPPNCSCTKRPFNRSFEVSCPPSTLLNLPYRLPNPNRPPPKYGRYDLQFSGSRMKFLESRDYFVDTYRLDVSGSQIETVVDEAWRSLQRADQVDLSGNRLVTLPRLLQTENVTFRWIALHGNPLSCDCEQRWLATWLGSLAARNALHRPDSIKCQSPDWLRGNTILSLNGDDFCRNPDRERALYVFKIVVPAVAGAILLVSVCFLVLYRCRVKAFAVFNVHPFDVDECNNENMAFDAFVSCAWPDDGLARDIVDRLEKGNVEARDRGGYRVCYHSRDFPLGAVILRSIQQSVEHSKRVICLLSEAFLTSEFCMLEFRTAWQWNLQQEKHRLIVVKCPGVDEALAAAERDAVAGVDDVRLFLSTYTYIEYDSADWWQKLLYAMPINRLPAVNLDFHHQFFTGPNEGHYGDEEEPLLRNV